VGHTHKGSGHAALRMIDLLTSVGAETFDLTRTNLKEEHVGNQHNIPTADLIRRLPAILAEANRYQQSVIARPRSTKGCLHSA
jgi:hypothetical protein